MKNMKRLLLFVNIFLIITPLLAQQVDTAWTKTLGSTGNESTSSVSGMEWSNPIIKIDNVGNLYVVGRSNTLGGDVQDTIGGEDCWIVKLNTNGDTLWTKVFGGTADDIPADLLVFDNGDFIVTGYTFSNDGDFIGNHGSEDGFVTKFDSNGNVMWSKLYGGGLFLGSIPGHDIIKGVTLLSNGNLLAVGSTNSNNGDLPMDLNKFGAAWILRIDTANGNLLNTKKVVGPNHNEQTPNLLISVSELSDGSGYYALGETRYGIQPFRMWLVKFDNNDNMLWNKEFGSTTDNSARSVIAMSNGSAMISGIIGFADGDVSSWFGGFYDIWIAIVDTNQNIVNERTFGGSQGSESLYTMKKITNNSYIFGGSAASTDNYLHQNLGSSDFWLVNYDSNLDTNWTYDFGGTGIDQITGIAPDNNGNIFVTGRTESNDLYVHNNHGGRDIFVAKIQNAFPIGIIESKINNTSKLYPNPTNNEVNLITENTNKQKIKVIIYNSVGQTVKSIVFSSNATNTKRINVKDLVRGIYFVKIQIGSRIETQKLIINR